ncbi:UDP-N-acetylglucosamine 2-epimerase (non-hydrolyzing) [Mucilaginibacter sp. HC2]|nr:UDP-N-acetylglucosamine 2-epimerase (non-hydrolyzing) [Mucilaginibacter inviolabilis]
MNKVLIIFGTRPEAIKMAPLVKAFQYSDKFITKVCVTAQHRHMLDQVLQFFEITPDFDLNLMKPNQNLYTISSEILLGLKPVLDDFKPDYVYVHGDTTTSTFAAVAAFYSGAKVCHIEAGLRTYEKLSPFPEEINRQLTSRIADWHLAPTPKAKQNLINEGIKDDTIIITGNTVIDALFYAVQKLENYEDSEINYLNTILDSSKKLVLVTGHRRENFGNGFLNICKALKKIALHEDVQIVYPVHLNPNVLEPVHSLLNGVDNINLIEPLSYPAFVYLMKKSYLILTDSGGVQEEAPSLGKPVLVMRDTTERPEALAAGCVILVGTDPDVIVFETERLLNDETHYQNMSEAVNPYGDGNSSNRVLESLIQVV